MASVNTWKRNAAPPSKSEAGRRRRESGVPVFVVAVVLLSLLCQQLMWHSFGNPTVFGGHGMASPAPRAHLGMPFVMLMELLHGWFVDAHGVPMPMLGQFIAVAAASGFLALLWRDVATFSGRTWASVMVLLVAGNPLFLQPLLEGDVQMVALLAFYGLCRTLRRLQGEIETFTYLRLAGWLCVLLSIHMQTALLALVIAPWLLLVAPVSLLRQAPLSFYLVCYLPSVLVLVGWGYLNLTLFNGSWPSLGELLGQERGVPLFAAQLFATPWPPLLRCAVAAMIGFPVLVLAWRARRAPVARAVLATVGTIASAMVLAAWLGWQIDGYLALLWVPVALLLRAQRAEQNWLAAALLMLGMFGGLLVYRDATPVALWHEAAGVPAAVADAASAPAAFDRIGAASGG